MTNFNWVIFLAFQELCIGNINTYQQEIISVSAKIKEMIIILRYTGTTQRYEMWYTPLLFAQCEGISGSDNSKSCQLHVDFTSQI